MNRDISETWQELIQRHLDGIASEDEVATLSAKIESCSETRALYLKLQQIHAILINGDFDEPLSNDSEHRVLELLSYLEQSNRRLRSRQLVLTLGSLAAAVLVMLGSWSLWNSQSDTIAEIISMKGVGHPKRRRALLRASGEMLSNAFAQSRANRTTFPSLSAQAFSIIRRATNKASPVPRPRRNPN